MDSLIRHIMSWQRATFGSEYREAGLIAHIKKELEEIEAAEDLKHLEWLDVIFLAIQGYHTALGETPRDAATSLGFDLNDKLEENMRRKWPPLGTVPPSAPIEHDRNA